MGPVRAGEHVCRRQPRVSNIGVDHQGIAARNLTAVRLMMVLPFSSDASRSRKRQQKSEVYAVSLVSQGHVAKESRVQVENSGSRIQINQSRKVEIFCCYSHQDTPL